MTASVRCPRGGGRAGSAHFLLNRPTVYSKVKTQKNLPDRHCCLRPCVHSTTTSHRETPESSDGLFHGLISPEVLRLHDFRLRNDLYCVEWGVKLYSLTHCTTTSLRHTTFMYLQEESKNPVRYSSTLRYIPASTGGHVTTN